MLEGITFYSLKKQPYTILKTIILNDARGQTCSMFEGVTLYNAKKQLHTML